MRSKIASSAKKNGRDRVECGKKVPNEAKPEGQAHIARERFEVQLQLLQNKVADLGRMPSDNVGKRGQ